MTPSDSLLPGQIWPHHPTALHRISDHINFVGCCTFSFRGIWRLWRLSRLKNKQTYARPFPDIFFFFFYQILYIEVWLRGIVNREKSTVWSGSSPGELGQEDPLWRQVDVLDLQPSASPLCGKSIQDKKTVMGMRRFRDVKKSCQRYPWERITASKIHRA